MLSVKDLPVPLGSGSLAQIACLWEATARKLGNVHPHADFTDTSYMDFLLSAAALGEVLNASPARPIGETILQAVIRTRALVGRNTNLGMILLLVPLAQAAGTEGTLRTRLEAQLTALQIADTIAVYRAIRLAAPGGLGEAPEQDVHDEPAVTLREAMQLAADRDQIARQYANGFADVFDCGVPILLQAFERFGTLEAAIVECQLGWLAEFPDSLIARKNGSVIAEQVRNRVRAIQALGGIATRSGRAAAVELDRYLRSDGNRLNPGSTADLIAACLFVALREHKVMPSAPFRWLAEDWL